jgi:acetyl esterase/lipase
MAGGLFTIQPFKALYTLFAVLYELSKFPLWVLLALPRFTRAHPQWTMKQAIRMRIVKAFLKHTSAVRAAPKLSLEPGLEGDRFVVLPPAGSYAFKGPTEDREIKPGKVGGTWYPAALQRSQAEDADVVLHFHGGAYVIGDGRDKDAGFAAVTILKHARITHVFAPQYRLSSSDGGRYPAALQDAVTAYLHLIEKLRIPSSRITISGDSAGGNLALALLRYISEHGKNLGLPWPGCVWLWSPWVNIQAGLDPKNIALSPQYHTDYLGPNFGYWGSSTLTFNKNPRDPYISPLGHPFQSKSPIFVQTGRAEVLYDDNIEIAQQFKDQGTTVELLVKQNAPHDIILIGPLIGFAKEAQDSAKVAGEFLRSTRLTY